MQVVRTYPARRPRYPFAPDGERSIARTYLKVLRRAERLIYLEDQYLWSEEGANALVEALRRAPQLHIVAIVPRHPDRDGRFSGPPYRIGQDRVFRTVKEAAPDRVAIFDIENAQGYPIYVHAKVCVIDDVWLMVGSDNLNRRSWTNDSELSCAVIDAQFDEREPRDPAGLGDNARVLARETRLRLWREHLGRADGEDDDLVEFSEGARAMVASARTLDAWHANGKQGPRPSGGLRTHEPEPVPAHHAWWASVMYRTRGRPGWSTARDAAARPLLTDQREPEPESSSSEPRLPPSSSIASSAATRRAASSSLRRAARCRSVYWFGGIEPSRIASIASSASPASRSHSEKLSSSRPLSTSRRTSHDIGATYEYAGQSVSLLWQS